MFSFVLCQVVSESSDEQKKVGASVLETLESVSRTFSGNCGYLCILSEITWFCTLPLTREPPVNFGEGSVSSIHERLQNNLSMR